MKFEFKEIREKVKVVEVLARYKVSLRYRSGSDYACGVCPLRCHPPDKRDNAFCVHLPSNRFTCKNTTCQKTNGVGELWGDCINLVAAIEGVGFKDAAALLVEWFPQDKNPAQQVERERDPRSSSVRSAPANTLEPSKASGNGKGYMSETNLWLDEVLQVVPEDDRSVLKKLLAQKIYESYKNGKAAHG